MTHHLAQINIARLVAPIGDPRIADFVAQLDEINVLAEKTPGFVWRWQSDAGNATNVVYGDDPFVVVNMSVWESIEALRDYTYTSKHVDIFRRRAAWFQKPDKPHCCLWWMPAGQIPSVTEGRERLEHYQTHGATEYSFWFSQLFPVREPVRIY